MAETKTKRSPAFLFLVAFIIIIIIMFIANQSKDVEVALEMPFNEGIRALSTYKNPLMAVSSDGKIFVWDWDKLSEKPRTGSVASEYAVLVGPDKVASLRQSGRQAVVVTDVSGGIRLKEISIGPGNKSESYLCTNHTHNALAVVQRSLQNSKNAEVSYKFMIIDVDAGRVAKEMTITEKSADSWLTNFAVSDDGSFIAGVGEQDGHARIVFVNMEQKQTMWTKTLSQTEAFGGAIFSIDNKTIYSGGSDGAVYIIQASDGKLVDQFQFKGKAAIPHETISVRHMTISPDSSLLAYIYGFNMYVFDCKTKRQIHSQSTGHKLPGPLAFSPDSSLIATSDLRQGGKIRVWPRPSE
jgi:WD40 repeat protein